MKALFTLCFLFFTLSSFSQTLKTDVNGNEFVVESANLKELQKFKWKDVTKYFKDIDKKETVSIRVIYKNPANETEKKGQIDNFNFTVSGEAKNAKDLTAKVENLLEILTGKF